MSTENKYAMLCDRLDRKGFWHLLHRKGEKLELRVCPVGEPKKILARAIFDPDRPNLAAVAVAEQMMDFTL